MTRESLIWNDNHDTSRVFRTEPVPLSVIHQPLKKEPPRGFKCRDKFLIKSVEFDALSTSRNDSKAKGERELSMAEKVSLLLPFVYLSHLASLAKERTDPPSISCSFFVPVESDGEIPRLQDPRAKDPLFVLGEFLSNPDFLSLGVNLVLVERQ